MINPAVFFLLFFCPYILLAQNDVDIRNLKGSVKSYKETVLNPSYIGNTKGPLVEISTRQIYFNPLGKIMEEREHDLARHFEEKKVYSYDTEFGYQINSSSISYGDTINEQIQFNQKGEKIVSKTFSGSGILFFTSNYIYNTKGKIVESKTIYTDDAQDLYFPELKNTYLYTYDSNGNNTEVLMYNKYKSLQSKAILIYDQDSQLTDKQIFDAKNKLVYKESYEYDNHGNLIKENKRNFQITHQYDSIGKKKSTIYLVDNKEGNSTLYEYHDNGLLSKESYFQKDRLLNKIEYRYNEASQIIEEIEEDIIHPKTQRRIFRYDELGNKIEKKWINNSGDLVEIWSCIYDKKGKRVREALYNKDKGSTFFVLYYYNAKEQKIKERIYQKSYFHKNLFEIKTTYLYDKKDSLILKTDFENNSEIERDSIIYDSKGNIIERVSYSGLNKIGNRHTFKYNLNGKLIDETTLNSDGSLQSRITYHDDEKERISTENMHNSVDEIYRSFVSTYDKNGNLLSRKTLHDNVLEDLITYKYDNKNLQEENSYNSKGEIFSTTQYQYDNIGNLTLKIKKDLGEIKEMINYEIVYYR